MLELCISSVVAVAPSPPITAAKVFLPPGFLKSILRKKFLPPWIAGFTNRYKAFKLSVSVPRSLGSKELFLAAYAACSSVAPFFIAVLNVLKRVESSNISLTPLIILFNLSALALGASVSFAPSFAILPSRSSIVVIDNPPVLPPASLKRLYSKSFSFIKSGFALNFSAFIKFLRITFISSVIFAGLIKSNTFVGPIFAIAFTNASERSRVKLGIINSGLYLVYNPPRYLLATIDHFITSLTCFLFKPFIAAATPLKFSSKSIYCFLPSTKTLKTLSLGSSSTSIFLFFPVLGSRPSLYVLPTGLTFAIPFDASGLASINFLNARFALFTSALLIAPDKLLTIF